MKAGPQLDRSEAARTLSSGTSMGSLMRANMEISSFLSAGSSRVPYMNSEAPLAAPFTMLGTIFAVLHGVRRSSCSNVTGLVIDTSSCSGRSESRISPSTAR